MKTDKEAAEEFAGKNWKTMGHENIIDVIHDTFLAACKHKEESRWIPVSVPPENHGVYYVANEYGHVHEVWYNWQNKEWSSPADYELKYEYTVKFYQPKLIPTPPQTNK